MTEDNTKITDNTVGTDADVDYVEIVKNLRESTVDKSDYDRLKAENVKLMKTLAEGGTITTPEKTKEKTDIKALRTELYGSDSDLCNLEYAKKTLDLRNAIIAEGGIDPFLPNGYMIKPTAEDVAAANEVADLFQHCIEYADGDPMKFTSELDRCIVDPVGFRPRR